jgi:hypothetical protein
VFDCPPVVELREGTSVLGEFSRFSEWTKAVSGPALKGGKVLPLTGAETLSLLGQDVLRLAYLMKQERYLR